MVRSAQEIAGLLESMIAQRDPVTASVAGGEVLFVSRLVRVEPGAIVLACADEKRANSALLAETVVSFACNHKGVHYRFAAGEPREAEHEGLPAIRLVRPTALIALQRRLHARTPVPPSVQLRCDIRVGPLSFRAQVVDISTAGIGSLIYEVGVRLEPGMRLERATIHHPEREPVVVDMEVRHVTRVLLPSGGVGQRAGCRIVAAAADLEALVRLFVTEF